jgi:integrase
MSDFSTELKKKWLETKKLSESSLQAYFKNLLKLNDDKPLKNLKFLEDVPKIVEKLSKYKENTKRNYLIAITSVLSLDKTSKKKQGLYDNYFKLMMEKNKELKQIEGSNEKSETQKENWLSWKEVERIRDELNSKVETFKTLKELSPSQYDVLLQCVILSLYTYLPPRRNDYQHMMITKSPNGSDMNYYDIDKKQFIFNKFKTAKKEGQVVINIPNELQNVLSTYLRFHPDIKGKIKKKFIDVPFLVFYDGKPFTQVNSITRILNKIFGKKIGSSMLRHLYLSNKYGDISKEQKEDAKEMSHSLATQKDYVKV